MHRASAKERPELWEEYSKLQEGVEGDGAVGECDVMLERVSVPADLIPAVLCARGLC